MSSEAASFFYAYHIKDEGKAKKFASMHKNEIIVEFFP